MAVSNYQATKSQAERVEQARRLEELHITHVPEGEREEIRQIFLQKGFEGQVLDEVVDVITKDKKLWVDTMLTEELGLQIDGPASVSRWPNNLSCLYAGRFDSPVALFSARALSQSHLFL